MQKSRVELAIAKHDKGYNCCQAVVCAYCDMFGIKEQEAFRMTEALGLGLAGLMETCGAVSAMMILAGLKNSDGNMENPTTKRSSYALGKELADKFKEMNKSIVCRELKAGPLRSCSGCIADAAKIVEEVLFAGEFEPFDGEIL
ncbi:MAG: C_GCAxxG_C_C family protein [Clostridia bacterium]|nr:C_GCAxxG_C_C family protein [Clostridia bacterium]